jgi:hypothetical protein
MEQLELELQWITETHQLLARNEETRKVWEVQVNMESATFLWEMAMLNHFVRDFSSRNRDRCSADRPRIPCMRIFSEQLSNIDQSNAKAMMSFAGLVVAFRFGSSLTPGSPDGPSLASLIDMHQQYPPARSVLGARY